MCGRNVKDLGTPQAYPLVQILKGFVLVFLHFTLSTPVPLIFVLAQIFLEEFTSVIYFNNSQQHTYDTIPLCSKLPSFFAFFNPF